MPTARFSFDAGSGTLLWATDEAARELYPGYAIDLELLPVSRTLRDELLALVGDYDSSMNWDYPPDPGPWREPRCREFNAAVRRAVARLRDELGPEWRIEFRYRDLHEDPDLDRYLADPAGFKRE
ncbi:MAG: hypothetical protein ACRDSK_10835 [Actinophytocola sp.]|uniref:hypothetical protein n=1 Tax=Actinophytocola sp. TaxID=1872138 RepID=UPI003D6A8D42